MNFKLKRERMKYKNQPIPNDLRKMVDEQLGIKKRKSKMPMIASTLVAAAVLAFMVAINTNTAMAKSMADIPVIGHVFKALTFNVSDENMEASITTPKVTKMESKKLESELNQKYEADSKALYKGFEKRMNEQSSKGHYSVHADYKVLQDNKNLLVIERSILETEASGYQRYKYDVVDPNAKKLIKLPMLFKDQNYVSVISKEIKKQMIQEMKATKNKKMYFVLGANLPDEKIGSHFKKIAAKQQFYINKKNQLVISFNEYEVAPGYMGAVKFTIPTKVIQKELVSNKYIK